MKLNHATTSKALQVKIEKLTAGFLRGQEPNFLRRHTRILDNYFQHAFETSMVGPRMEINRNPYAIVALGGYGRQEQCIHSDVDLLFLFENKVPAEAEGLIQEMIYPLWDLGLDVGYATRSMQECISLASKDYEILTPLLDARFVCGGSLLYSELMNLLREKIIKKKSNKIIDWIIQYNRARHLQYGDSAYLLEPNLKEGQGGLRDYHTMLWIARVDLNLKHPRDLLYFGQLSHEEYQTLMTALEFIWNVRNRLHYICQRKCDQLHFENQIKLAEVLKFKRRNGQQPVERFLGELHGWTEYLKQQYLMFLYELGLEKKRRRKKKARFESRIEGLEIIEGGMLNFVGPVEILKVPDLLIQIFEESARLKIPLSSEAKRLVREFSHLVDEDFRSSPTVIKSFERILAAPVPIFNVLNEMLNTGFLGAFIPEFQHIINRIQYDEYHLYPVDKHALHTVRKIKELAGSGDSNALYKQVYKEIKNKKLLLWTALLHDIGKGYPEDNHSERGAAIVRAILQEKGAKPRDIETAEFLVKEHLFLMKTATRRDINDEETAIVCGRKIKNPERLKMLYLLSVADAMSTGPMAWNDWNGALLRDLFLKVLNVLEKGELATREAMETVTSKKADIIKAAPTRSVRDTFESLFDAMSPRYLLYTPAADIVEHVNLYKTLEDNVFVWKIERSAKADAREITICAPDRPGLISKIAGVFTLNNIDILDVQVFTWRNNIALDIFKVKPPPDQLFEDEKWKRTQIKLEAALTGEENLAGALNKKFSSLRRRKTWVSRKRHRIRVDNKSSSFFTIIEVFTYDFPGLLFSVTDALFNCDLDIWLAKIATKADQVVDVFYVRDLNGQKVDDKEQVKIIKESILKRLPPVG